MTEKTPMSRLEMSAPIPLHVGPSIRAVEYGDCWVVLQSGNYPLITPEHNGRLLVLDGKGKTLGTLNNLGSARQIVMQGSVAYVTSREDGLFVVELKDPSAPRLLCHYETAEFATGIAVANDLLIVSLRQYGLELIDVRDPKHPRFISLIRTGEAQSVCLDGHYAYAGVWGSRELVIADIARPESPEIACRVPLDGRGDGVAVRNGICYAATGHHARPPEGMENPPPETYEKMGNGLELFDVGDPRHPVRLSGIKFPPYYGLTFDMWQVRLSGNLALVSDTRNGFFPVDISDPRAPKVLGRVQLPDTPEGGPDPIGGFGFSGNQVLLAGGETDAYLVHLCESLVPEEAQCVSVSAAAPQQALSVRFLCGKELPWQRYLPDMQVQGLALDANRIFAACTYDGVLVLDVRDFRVLNRLPLSPGGMACQVVWRAPYLYVAEGPAGLSVFKEEQGGFVRTDRFSPYGRAVRDMHFSEDGALMLAQCASRGVIVLSVQDPAHPIKIGEYLDFIGLFYGRHFPSQGYGHNCYLGCNKDGIFRISEENGTALRENLPIPPGGYGFASASGLERLGDQLLAVCGSGDYFLVPLDAPQGSSPKKIPIPGARRCRGRPRVKDSLLVIVEQADGMIHFCDASDALHIRAVVQVETTASPDFACMDEDNVYIPGGRQGLLVFARPF